MWFPCRNLSGASHPFWNTPKLHPSTFLASSQTMVLCPPCAHHPTPAPAQSFHSCFCFYLICLAPALPSAGLVFLTCQCPRHLLWPLTLCHRTLVWAPYTCSLVSLFLGDISVTQPGIGSTVTLPNGLLGLVLRDHVEWCSGMDWCLNVRTLPGQLRVWIIWWEGTVQLCM